MSFRPILKAIVIPNPTPLFVDCSGDCQAAGKTQCECSTTNRKDDEQMSLSNAVWINGAEAAAPGAATQLCKIVPSPGKIGKVYGFRIVSQEANAAGKIWRLRKSEQGQTVILAALDVTNPTFIADLDNELALLKGNGVDFFEVINVVAGTALTIHQASILYEEVYA